MVLHRMCPRRSRWKSTAISFVDVGENEGEDEEEGRDADSSIAGLSAILGPPCAAPVRGPRACPRVVLKGVGGASGACGWKKCGISLGTN